MTNWLGLILIAEVLAGLAIVLLFWIKTQSQAKDLRKSADKALKYQLADRVQPVVNETFLELRQYIEQLHKQLEKNFTKEQEQILLDLSKLGTIQHKELEKKIEKTMVDANDYWLRFVNEQQRSLQTEVEQIRQQHLAHLAEIHQLQTAQIEKMYQEQQDQLQASLAERANKLDAAATAALTPLIGQKLTVQLSKDDQHDLAMQLLTDFLSTSKTSHD